MTRWRAGLGALVPALAAALFLAAGREPSAEENPKLSYHQVTDLARAYMADEDAGKRAEILEQVAGWSERLDEIALALRPVPPADAPVGYLAADRFTLPRVRARMQRLIPRLPGP
ncbi:MAG: hypothetical protein HY321_01560, partial [Armatimonadetes bacterium]|nr:hypothetical protein [Armatimonadota bacterium]